MTDGLDPTVRAVLDGEVAAVRAHLLDQCGGLQRARLAAGVDAGVVATAFPLAGVHLLADLLAHFVPATTLDVMTAHMVKILEARAAVSATTAGMTRQ